MRAVHYALAKSCLSFTHSSTAYVASAAAVVLGNAFSEAASSVLF